MHARRYIRALNKWRKDYERNLERKGDKAYSVLEELALLDTMLEQLVKRAEEGDIPSWRKDVQAGLVSLRVTATQGNEKATALAFEAFGALVERGAAADESQAFLRGELERRGNFALRAQDVETRRSEQVTRAQAVALFREFFRSLRLWFANWVCSKCGEKDREAYASASAPLLRLVGGIGVEDDGDLEPGARARGPRSRAG